MRICAWFPPHILFFHFHTFFRREIPAVLSVFFSVRELFLGCFGRVCVVSYSVFFRGVCVLFFDSGFVWEFVWIFRFVLRDFSEIGENNGCQCESV